MQGLVANYMTLIQWLKRDRIEVRPHLRTSGEWTRPVEHCVFNAVQVATNAFIHFDYMRRT